MNARNSEYLHIWNQVRTWPLELRQDLILDINESVDADLAANGAWDEKKNSRRCELIDRDIQGIIGDDERCELELLTRAFRLHRQKVAPLPLAGAMALHQSLIQ